MFKHEFPHVSKPVSRALARIILVIVLLCVSIPGVQADSQRTYTFMTYNLYQGTELDNTIKATTLTELVFGVAADYNNVIATNYPERAAAIAAEIAQNKPQLVALQEVALWRIAYPYDPTNPTVPTTVSYDFLQILIDALQAQGLHYSVVNVSTNYDMYGPGLFSFGWMGVRLTDRNAIIARTDQIKVSNPQGASYQNMEYIPTFLGPRPVNASWISVDVGTGSKTFRFVATHLLGAVMDGTPDPVYPLQAQELLNGAANSNLPVVVAGDLNSTPADPAYSVFTNAGFVDAWAALHPNDPGYTAFQALPGISNPVSQLYMRIDHFLARGPFTATDAHLVGADPSSRTASGLWPSDHAGVVTTLQVGP